MINWLIPQSEAARKITLRNFVPALLVYITRILLTPIVDDFRGPLGFAWVFICLPICLIGLVFVALIVSLTIISVRHAHHFAPALVLLGGLALVSFLPLPPHPLPVFPEETFFAAHQAEFEQVVSLAQQGKLSCYSDCKYAARNLPPQYKSLSTEKFVLVIQDAIAGLVVRFEPFNFYYPVIYFERPDDSNDWMRTICSPSSSAVRKLDEHWYLCEEDWN